MKHIRLENNRIRFPTLPKLDKWLEDPKNERAVIAALAALCVAVWIWGASL